LVAFQNLIYIPASYLISSCAYALLYHALESRNLDLDQLVTFPFKTWTKMTAKACTHAISHRQRFK